MARTDGPPCIGWTPRYSFDSPWRRQHPERLHGVAEEGIPMRAIAETIGQEIGVPVRSLTEDEAKAHFDWFARFVAIDKPTSGTLTRDSLGWNPQEINPLTDTRGSKYFT